MIGVSTLGMIAKNAKLDPAVIADVAAGTIQGYLHTIGSDGKADAPVAGTDEVAQTDAMYIALNDLVGDARYTDATIAQGDKLDSYLVKAWVGQTVWADSDNFEYATGETYETIIPHQTVLVPNTNGKLSIVDGTTIDLSNYKVAFRVVRKFSNIGKDALVLKIDSGTLANVDLYTVTYDDNGGTGSVPEDTAKYRVGVPVTVDFTSASLPTRTGYRFMGWDSDDEATEATYTDGGLETFSMSTTNVTLYAIWETTYTVTYDGNTADSGSVPTDNKKYIEGEDVTVSFTHTLVKGGKTLAGWATAADATEAEYADGATETFEMGSANVTLYAVWATA